MFSNVHFNVVNRDNAASMARGMQGVELSNQAHALSSAGDIAGAERLHQQALSKKESAYGADSAQAALSRNALGEVQLKLGKLNEAEANLNKAVEIRNGDNFAGMDAAVSRENLAQVYEAKGALKGAKDMRLTGAPNSLVCAHEHCPGHLKKLAELSACSKCKSVFYCSKKCQITDWNTRHKALCRNDGGN